MSDEALTRRQALLWKSQTGGFDATLLTSSGMGVVRASPPVYTPGLALYEDEAVRDGFYVIPPKEGPVYGGTLTFSVDLLGLLASLPSADVDGDFLSAVLEQLLGGQVAAGYAAAAIANWAASEVEIASAVASNLFKAGGAIIGKLDTGAYEMAVLKQVTDGGGSNHALATLFPLIGTDVGSPDTSWGTRASYLAEATPTGITFWQQTKNAAGLLIYGGCVCTSLKFDASARANPKLELTFQVAEVIPDQVGAVLTATSYTQPQMKPPTSKTGGRLVVGSTNTRWHTLNVEIATTLLPLGDHNAGQGVGDVVVTDRRVMLKYKVPLTGAATALTTLPTLGAIGLFLGTQPGQMHALVWPNPVLTSAAPIGDEQGAMMQEFTAEVGQASADTGSDATTNADFRWYQG